MFSVSILITSAVFSVWIMCGVLLGLVCLFVDKTIFVHRSFSSKYSFPVLFSNKTVRFNHIMMIGFLSVKSGFYTYSTGLINTTKYINNTNTFKGAVL